MTTDQVREGYRLVAQRMREKEWDYVTVIDGSEGKGKSSLAMLLATYTDEGFDGTRVAFELDELFPLMEKAPKLSSIVFDEAIQGAYRREAMTGDNRALNKAAMISRKRGLHLIMCIPNFWDLETYFQQRRAKVWFSVDRRGRAVVHFPSRNRYRRDVFWKPTHNYEYPAVDAGLWANYSVTKDDYIARNLARASNPEHDAAQEKARVRAEATQANRDAVEEIRRLGIRTSAEIMAHYAEHGNPMSIHKANALRRGAWPKAARPPITPSVSMHAARESRTDPAGEAAP